MLSKKVYDAAAQTSVTTSMAYDNANELTSTTAGGVTTTYAYDAWGRATSKTDGTNTATYGLGKRIFSKHVQ